jgi:hypothetical protein
MRCSANFRSSSSSRYTPVVFDEAEADLVRHDLAVEQPGLGLRDGEHLGQDVVQLEDLDPALAHLAHEVDVVPACVLHHITSSNSNLSQLVGVRRMWASPGALTRTFRSVPTSECTPYAAAGCGVVSVMGGSS